MASIEVIERVLTAIATNHGRHPLWVEDSKRMWMLQLEDISDRDLIIGVKDVLRKVKSLPTLAQVREVVEANPTTKAGTPVKVEGCRACGGTGMRQMSRWWIDERHDIRVFNGVAACDCAKGLKLSMGAFTDFRDVITHWESNPHTTRVHYSTKDQPVLSTEQTVTARDLAARKARAEARGGQ